MNTGLLSAVGSLMLTVQNSMISLNWTAPFTLDIPGDPDITYCVGVVYSTSSSTLHSQCGITETEYEYPIPPDSACHDHMVTVTPVNSAGNGTSSTLTYSQTTECKCNTMPQYLTKLYYCPMTCVAPQVNEVVSVPHATYTIVMVSCYYNYFQHKNMCIESVVLLIYSFIVCRSV